MSMHWRHGSPWFLRATDNLWSCCVPSPNYLSWLARQSCCYDPEKSTNRVKQINPACYWGLYYAVCMQSARHKDWKRGFTFRIVGSTAIVGKLREGVLQSIFHRHDCKTQMILAAWWGWPIIEQMGVLLNGQERTLDHQIRLAGLAGWKVVDVKNIPNSHFGYIIAEPASLAYKNSAHL